MITKSPQKYGENAWLWMIKIVTGLMIITLIIIHFVVNHLISHDGLLSHNDIVVYYKNWFVPLMEICFLVFAVTHSLIGMRSILLDMNPSRRVGRIITLVFILIGSGFISYGTWLVWTIKSF